MADEPKKTQAAVYGAIWFEKELLLLGRKKWIDEGTPWIMPGGAMRSNEIHTYVTLLRELKEEIDFIPDPVPKNPAGSYKTEWTDRLIVYELDNLGYKVEPDLEKDKFFGWMWLDTDNKQMLDLFWPQLMPGLRMYLKDKLGL